MSLITALRELLGDHGVAAVLDDNGLAVLFLNVGQRLHQDGGALHMNCSCPWESPSSYWD